MSAQRTKIRQTKGLSFPKLGDRWYVFSDGKNVLMGFETEQAAREAADKHFDPKRKKNLI